MIDSGAATTSGPTDEVNALYASINGSRALDGDNADYYVYPCDAEINLSIEFGGVSYPISSASLNYGPALDGTPDYCTGSVLNAPPYQDP